VVDVSNEYSPIAARPVSARIVTDLGVAVAATLAYYAIAPTSISGTTCCSRTGYTGEDGFEIYCSPGGATDVWQTLSGSGAAHGLVPAGLACRDSLRLEAGMALYGHELSTTVNPFEVGLGRLVAFDKPGGFVGDVALAALRDDTPRRRLVGLSATGRRSPRAGDLVYERGSERPVGRVTSGSLRRPRSGIRSPS
jgi:aminomethyltransferase